MFTDSFADVNPYMAKFLHENMDEDEEYKAVVVEAKDTESVSKLVFRMAEEKRQEQSSCIYKLLFPSERFIL